VAIQSPPPLSKLCAICAIRNLLCLLLDVNPQMVVVLLLNLLVAELFGLGDRAVELGNQALPPCGRTKPLDGLLGGNKPLRFAERIVHNFIA
jgi:hypothetical protein